MPQEGVYYNQQEGKQKQIRRRKGVTTMTFKEAYKIAMQNEDFSKFDKHVKDCVEKGMQSACKLFSIDGICFYYGFDGSTLHKGKPTQKRSEYLIKKGETLIIY